MRGTADRFLERHPELLTEDLTSPAFSRWMAALMGPIAGWFRTTTQGFYRIPEGPCLLVANHNIGALWEVLLLLRVWRLHFGERPARGLMHQIGWQWPFKMAQLQRVGGVFAHREVALANLRRGAALLVFPGGDVEACRPWSDRYKVTFDGRSGFVKLAREAGVPIVPLVICGSHAAYVSLPGSRKLAAALRMERWLGLKAYPFTLGIALFWLCAAIPPLWPLLPAAFAQSVIPSPARIEIEALDPMSVGGEEDDAAVAVRVEAAMQAAMDRLAARRSSPWG